MARVKKKVRNFKIEQEELKPMIVGVFESRKKSSIGTFIILTTFILFIFFLPQISDIVKQYLNPEPTTPLYPNKPINPTPPNEGGEEEEDNFKLYTTDLKITNDDLSISDIVVDQTNNTLSYVVTNNGSPQDIEDLNYYIEIYDIERTMIERVKLANELTLTTGSFRTLTKNISNNAATSIGYLVLIKKNILEYPEVNLMTGEDENASLICQREHEKITYKFKENKLKELISEMSYSVEDLDYSTKYEEQKNLVNTYNGKTGISSTFFEYDSGYNITTSVNLTNINRQYIFNADTFELDTEPKVVKFEMESQNFTCE